MDIKKKHTVILIAVAVALIAGAGYYFWQKRQNTGGEPLYTDPISPKVSSSPVIQAVPVPSSTPVVASAKPGASAYPKGTSVNVRTSPSTSASILFNVKKGIKAGVSTGVQQKMSDGVWYKLNTAKGAGWVRNDVVTLSYV